ncbi:MAG TPA: hypothetical protein VNE39_28920 [Planctomycetota bacterium]|nr:hypothetical protein [Planctomycetota bacterium]
MRRVVFAVAVVACVTALAREVHVSPAGTPEGDGSKERPLDVFTALSAKSPAQPGDTILLAGGVYEGKMDGIKRIPFALAVSGTKEKPIRVTPVAGQSAHLNGTAALTSSYAEYVGLEIGDLKWDATQKEHKAETALNATGGTGAKVINCNLFGGAMGTGCWSPAVGLELYGCLIHDFGYLDPRGGRGHGHAYYAQNEKGTKVFQHNIAYRGCGWNVHVYTQGGQITGFDLLENICYIAGAYKPGQTMDNYLIYGYVPADRIRLIGNVGYQPTDVERWRPNARMSHLKAVQNLTGEVRDNYLAGAFYGLSLGDWKKIEVTGNTIWSTGIHVEISSSPTGSALGKREAKPDLSGYKLDGNTYIANGKGKTFYHGASENKVEAELLTFAQWQALGLDKTSKVEPGKNGKPTGTRVFVFPNKYQKGRANVAIFNWDGHDKVEVDLSSVLGQGQMFRVYNCLDIKQTLGQAKPVLEGKHAGGKLAFPIRKDRVSPDFDAFLVIPE